jgi:transposase-like protein
MKAARPKPGSTWRLDEMFVILRGEPYLLWRAVDEHGVELDIANNSQPGSLRGANAPNSSKIR